MRPRDYVTMHRQSDFAELGDDDYRTYSLPVLKPA